MNKNYVSKATYGDRRSLSDGEARQIENLYNLPSDWFDRDNAALIQMSAMEYNIVTALLAANDKMKAAILAVLEASE